MLHVETSGSGPRLVLVHGFTQTCRSWGRFGDLLEADHELVRVDLPGHGDSSDVRADLVRSADLLAEAAGSGDGAGANGEPIDMVGYSLGARVALHAALGRAGAVRRLVLIGGTAGIEDPEARAARRRRDEELAGEVEADMEGFLARWVAAPMFAGLREKGLDERRRNTPAGLASNLRLAGAGTQEPLWDRLGALECPVATVAGAGDVRFALAAMRIARLVPRGVCSLVPGAGHAAHLEQPELCALMVSRFLA